MNSEKSHFLLRHFGVDDEKCTYIQFHVSKLRKRGGQHDSTNTQQQPQKEASTNKSRKADKIDNRIDIKKFSALFPEEIHSPTRRRCR